MYSNIPLQNIALQNSQIREELIQDFANVLDSGRYVSGPGVEKFEKEFANYVGSNFGIGLSSGSSALELALKGVGVQKGDEVIVPSMTFIASVEAILEVDAIPVVIDIETVYVIIVYGRCQSKRMLIYHLSCNTKVRIIRSIDQVWRKYIYTL